MIDVSKGDVWVAQDGGYGVKYVGQATGKDSTLGSSKMAQVTYNWTYDVTEINAVKPFALPAECEAAKPANDLPVPPNATSKAQIGGITSYKVPDKVAAVVDYLRKALTGAGWTEAEGGVVADESANLNFAKDKRKLMIIVGKDSDGTTVLINESKEE